MKFVLIIWSCALHDPYCTHPDATWSGYDYVDAAMAAGHTGFEAVQFRRANPTREIVETSIMTQARWEALRGGYSCGRLGGQND